MGKKFLQLFVCVMAAAGLLIGCAAPKPMTEEAGPAFRPVDLSAKLKSGEYVQKVNTFMVIMDASGTMTTQSFEGRSKFAIAKDFVNRMNRTIPDMDLTAGLRTFGQGFSNSTGLAYELTDYSKGGLESAIAGISGGGYTPLARAISAAGEDLKAAGGNIAVIIVSDGLETDRGSLKAAENMKRQLGDRVCIYTVVVGDDPVGKSLLEQIARAGACGFSVDIDEVLSGADVADFVEKVFLAHTADSDRDGVPDNRDQCPDTPMGVKVDEKGCPLDSDGDGVPDDLDQCPNTPAGVKVDEKGCPLDSDGDGVPDYLDRCPRTPKGARVNEVGCWVLKDKGMKNVQFDFDRWNIKPGYYPVLDRVVAILLENPGLKVEIQGHTCSMGAEAYNQGLSEKRAISVLNYLVKKGIAQERLTAVGYGESNPAFPNDTREGRSKNRRVQLRPMD